MSSSSVTVTMHESVGVVTLDDGKVNALNLEIVDELDKAIDAVEREARALVVAGRPGVFCAGLDNGQVSALDSTTVELLTRCTHVVLRLREFRHPVVAACTGHAVAAGAVLLLCSDVRIGAAGDYKIGFSEVSQGFPVTELAVALARERLSPRYVTLACMAGQTYNPEQAAYVGFLDRTGPPESVIDEAVAAAAGMVDRVDLAAFVATRKIMARRLSDVIVRTSAELLQLRRGWDQGNSGTPATSG